VAVPGAAPAAREAPDGGGRINSLKQCRRIATRYEKRAANSLAMITIGMILLWLRQALQKRPIS
jgi:transposase